MNGYRILCSYQGYIIVLKLLLLLQGEVAADQELTSSSGYYTLTAPATIFSGRPYGVALTTFFASTSSFQVFLSGPSINMSMQLHTTFRFPSTSYVFDLPELVNGTYWLKITTLHGLQVENSTQLTWQNFKSFIKIQTPKALYRPGQLLQFRVFYHNETMIGVKPEPKASIWIQDSKRNIVKAYNYIRVSSGVFKAEFRLSQNPNLGDWRICAQNGYHAPLECTQIQVLKYELPAFKVNINAPAEVNVTDNAFEVSVSARYAIEGFVEGNVTLEMETFTDGDIAHKPIPINLGGTLENGTANITIALSQFKSMKSIYMPLKVQIIANVYDSYGKKEKTTTEVTLLGTYEDEKVTEAPKIESRARKPVNFIKIENFGIPLKNPDKIIFGMNRKLINAICVVMYNGLLLANKEVYPDPTTNDFEILIQFTTKLWPFVHVKLYSMESNTNVLLIASQTISITRSAHSHIKIEAPEQFMPGEETTLRIYSVPNSYVGLQAVDVRNSELGGSFVNDFTQDYFDRIKYIMRGFDLKLQQSDGQQSDGYASGLIILSNVDNILDVTEEVNFQHLPPVIDSTHSHAHIPARSKSVEEGDDCVETLKTRKDSNDVWIYDSIKKTQCNWTALKVRVPNYIATWKLSAFSIDPNVGLTLLMPAPFINIKSTKSLYMTINLPNSIQVDEVLEIILNCNNNEEEDQEVTIQLKQDRTRFQLLDLDGKRLPAAAFTEQKLIISNQSAVNFYLRALRPGTIKLAFTATSKSGNDSITRKIEVRNDMKVLSDQVVFYGKLNLNNNQINTKLELPHQPTTDGVECFVSGQVLVAKMRTLSPIEPSDNGEQLISKLISMYYMWNRVHDMTWLTKHYKEFLRDQLSDGFQSLMRLRRDDGGFAYTDKPANNCSSTWLTAYALQLFQLLHETPFNFGARLLLQCEHFLLRRIGPSGQFVDPCPTSRRQKSILELNIEVLKVLQLSKRMINLQGPQSWTNEQMKTETDYHLKAKHGLDPQIWQKPEKQTNISWMEHRRNLETAGRILSMDVRRQRLTQQFDIFSWLLTQNIGDPNNANCYECSVAEMAIYDYLQTQLVTVPKLSVSFFNNENPPDIIKIDGENRWTEQQVKLETQNQTIYFEAQGLDELLMRCQYEYVEENLRPKSRTNMHYSVFVQTEMQKLLEIQFCVHRLKINRQLYVGTNIELQLPSGYVLDNDSVQNLLETEDVTQASALDKNTKLFLVIEAKRPSIATCLSVLTRRYHKVENLQPASLTVYDTNCYGRREVFTYNVTSSTS